jgi:hypothetical protein
MKGTQVGLLSPNLNAIFRLKWSQELPEVQAEHLDPPHLVGSTNGDATGTHFVVIHQCANNHCISSLTSSDVL